MAHIQILEQIIDKTENPEEKEHPDDYPAEAAIPVNMLYQQIIKKDVVKYQLAAIVGRSLRLCGKIEDMSMHIWRVIHSRS